MAPHWRRPGISRGYNPRDIGFDQQNLKIFHLDGWQRRMPHFDAAIGAVKHGCSYFAIDLRIIKPVFNLTTEISDGEAVKSGVDCSLSSSSRGGHFRVRTARGAASLVAGGRFP